VVAKNTPSAYNVWIETKGQKRGGTQSDEKWPAMAASKKAAETAKMYAKESASNISQKLEQFFSCRLSFFNLKAAAPRNKGPSAFCARRIPLFVRRQRRACAGNLISHLSQVNIFCRFFRESARLLSSVLLLKPKCWYG
jgi:hypothetical protein